MRGTTMIRGRKVLLLTCVAALSVLIFGGAEALAQEFSFPVRHDHVFGSCSGELNITDGGVEYRTTKKDHARKWTYTEIRLIKLVSSREIEVLTYEPATKLELARDRTFEFKALKGEIPEDVNEFLLKRVAKPLAINFVKSDVEPVYAIPVRHRHRFGGEQGTLKIYPAGVAYDSAGTNSSRYWRWSDIKSFDQLGRYRLSITTFEPEIGGPTKTFNFDLKEEIDDAMYEYLWARVYRPTLPASPDVKREARSIQPQ